MQVEETNIIVIDSSEDRRNKMVKALRKGTPEHINVFQFNIQKQQIESDLEEEGVFEKNETERDYLAMLIHARDKDFMDITPVQEYIWYGGYSGPDPDVPNGQDKIDRAIASDILTVEEINALMDYLLGQGKRPDFIIEVDHELYEKTEEVVILMKKLACPEKKNWQDIKLPMALKEFEEVFEKYRDEALQLIDSTPGLTPFSEEYNELLTDLKSELNNLIGEG